MLLTKIKQKATLNGGIGLERHSLKITVIGIAVAALVVATLYLGVEKLTNSPPEEENKTSVEENQESAPVQTGWELIKREDEVNLLTRLIAAEATGEPYEGQVAVAAVMLNRVRHASFPNTVGGVIYQPHAFESVSNGLIWRLTDLTTARKAAMDALNGWDPTYGALYFWNPYKPVSSWIWTRKIVRQIGNHVFGI